MAALGVAQRIMEVIDRKYPASEHHYVALTRGYRRARLPGKADAQNGNSG
jgi:hypothetical protein